MDRRGIRRVRGLRFAKLLGTGSGQTFAMRDADPRHWALLTVWDGPADAAAFHCGPVHRAWQRLADEQLSVSMVPVAARGQWSGAEPFAVPAHEPAPPPGLAAGPMAAITRARLRPSRMIGFWRAVPPVAAELRSSPGLLMAMSMGEAPVGLAGTFSLWSSGDEMSRFARASPAHAAAIRRTEPQRWFAEELFARFAVQSAHGHYLGQDFGISTGTAGA